MTDSVFVGITDEIPLGQSKLYQVGSFMVSVFHTEAGWFAIEDRCPHRGGPLGEGTCQGTQVTCPWHGARFDLTTGACVSSSQISRVKTFSVTIQDPQIWVSNP